MGNILDNFGGIRLAVYIKNRVLINVDLEKVSTLDRAALLGT